MNNSAINSIEFIFIAGYVAFGSVLNLIALLISAFNQKKFNQSSPKTGFIIAITLAVIFIIILFSGFQNSMTMQIALILALLGSSIASILSIINLFFTMRKVRNR